MMRARAGRIASMTVVVVGACSTLVASPVHADDLRSAHLVERAMSEGRYEFCSKPRTPLDARRRALCPLAERPGCEGFAKACRDTTEPKPPERSWWDRLDLAWLEPLAIALLYLFAAAVVLVITIPILRALMARRRRRSPKTTEIAPKAEAAAVVAPPLTEAAPTEPEATLALADDLRLRGDAPRALALYLAASLAALERRGALRVARHRTHGEYVRACTEAAARGPLREIVREVDKVHFGRIPPTEASVTMVAGRATALVRRVATAAVIVSGLLAGGCGIRPGASHDDPAGSELAVDLLQRSGFDIGPLGRSLATIEDEAPPQETPHVLVVDVEQVSLEAEEIRLHLRRWVAAGGVLILFGSPEAWPPWLGARRTPASSSVLVFDVASGSTDEEDLDVEPKPPLHGKVAVPSGVTLDGAWTLGRVGDASYVVRETVGRGVVLGVAGDDLLTNVGVVADENAAILVTLLDVARRDSSAAGAAGAPGAPGAHIRYAVPEDAIPPPSTPFAALSAAGLGAGAWHGLVAALVLFLAHGIRHARPKRPRRQARRAFAEHVEAIGAFWWRTRALPHALAAYAQFVELCVRERAVRGEDVATFLATRTGVPRTKVEELSSRARAAKEGDRPRGDEIATLDELRGLLERALDHGDGSHRP